MAETRVFSIPLRTRFRGITEREGVLIEGPAGWGEFSPFLEYDAATAAPWLRCAVEAADVGWPAPRARPVPVNVTVPAVARSMRARSCSRRRLPDRQGQGRRARPDPGDDEARLEAVRDAIGPDGLVRIDANGGWSVDEAVAAIGCSSGRPADWSTSSSRAPRSRTSPSYAVASTCRSPPTSRSAGPPTPTGSATSRPPTSPY